jgi:hypothetical protein
MSCQQPDVGSRHFDLESQYLLRDRELYRNREEYSTRGTDSSNTTNRLKWYEIISGNYGNMSFIFNMLYVCICQASSRFGTNIRRNESNC